MSSITFALFESEAKARSAIEELKRKGVDEDVISVITKKQTLKETVAEHVDQNTGKNAIGGAVAGGVGGMLAGVGGTLTTILTQAGPVIFGGPVTAVAAAAGIVGAGIAGGVIGAATGSAASSLISLGFPKTVAGQYEKGLSDEGVLIGIPANTLDQTELKGVYKKYEGKNIHTLLIH